MRKAWKVTNVCFHFEYKTRNCTVELGLWVRMNLCDWLRAIQILINGCNSVHSEVGFVFLGFFLVWINAILNLTYCLEVSLTTLDSWSELAEMCPVIDWHRNCVSWRNKIALAEEGPSWICRYFIWFLESFRIVDGEN